MKIRIVSLLVLSELFLSLTVNAATIVNFPILEQFRVPPYPYLARLAGTEGAVEVDVSLDIRCDVKKVRVGEGDPRLVEAVMRSLYGGPVPMSFRSCAMPQPMVVHISYTFALEGEPTNRWSQTEVRVTTDRGKFFNVKITTSPPDLGALGLQKIKGRTKTRDKGDTEANARRNEDPDTVGLNTRELGTSGFVQTIFTSPNYGVSTANIQGDAKVEIELDSDCHVSNARALSGNVLLSEEVLSAVREWQFPGCSSEKRTLALVFHFLLTESDSPDPYGNWAPTHFEMIGPYEFKIRTVGSDTIIYDELPDK